MMMVMMIVVLLRLLALIIVRTIRSRLLTRTLSTTNRMAIKMVIR